MDVLETLIPSYTNEVPISQTGMAVASTLDIATLNNTSYTLMTCAQHIDFRPPISTPPVSQYFLKFVNTLTKYARRSTPQILPFSEAFPRPRRRPARQKSPTALGTMAPLQAVSVVRTLSFRLLGMDPGIDRDGYQPPRAGSMGGIASRGA